MKRRNIIILMISLSLVLLLGSSYALLRSSQVGSNPYVINVGTLQVTFENGKTEKLSLENMYPMSDKEGSSKSDELGFVVKNTGTIASYYDITLEETSTTPEFKSVIRFISNKDNQGYNEPKTLSEDKYIDVGGYLKSNASSNYKVKVWLDYNADNTYMDKTFTAKVVVNSFQKSDYAKDIIKSKLVKYSESSKEDFTGGLVAVNTDGDLYNETDESQEIREYRYSGPNVNNYVKLNNNNCDELWRIIGIFYDEEDKEEYIKIIRNELLSGDLFPENYIINDKIYSIHTKYETANSYGAYWNADANTNALSNDWAIAGIQYWLNSLNDDMNNKGYMNYLSIETKLMLKERTHYLGMVNLNTDIVKDVYVHERAVKNCNENKEISDDCRIVPGNHSLWRGKISLLYPSDYGYSVISQHWDKILENDLTQNNFFNSNINETSWIYETLIDTKNKYTFLLSPASLVRVGLLGYTGRVTEFDTNDRESGIRPVLNLKSNVKITSGTGEQNNPFKLTME